VSSEPEELEGRVGPGADESVLPTGGAASSSEAEEPARASRGDDENTAGGSGRGRRKVRDGVVVSDKMQRTVVVAVTERVRHPRYGKTVQRTKKFYADDTTGARLGDRVRLMETRPLSKLKRWRVVEILERAR
jgi:small subunit ribosomal protein S17